jgi:putative transposase
MNQDFVYGVTLVIHITSGASKNVWSTPLRRGRRLSIIGLLQPLISFVYGLIIGSTDRKSYIRMMEQEAAEAQETGRTRVIVQDNGPIHRCQEVQQLWKKWESQGLYIFFLPKYCSEMNPIELEWQHIKKDELSGQIFDDELDLAYAVRGDRKKKIPAVF